MMFIFGASLLDKKGTIFSPIARRISYADILFLFYFFASFIVYLEKSSKWLIVYSKSQRYFLLMLFAFSLWTGLSWLITTATLEGQLRDFFGIPVRLAYYGIISIFVTKWAKKYGINVIVFPFCIGILGMFYFNFFSKAIMISDFPIAIQNNDFSGLLLPVVSLYFSLSILSKPGYVSLALCFVSYCSTVLVYSLGGYILMIMALPAVLISFWYCYSIKGRMLKGKFIFIVVTIGIGLSVVFGLKPNQETITNRIKAKIANLPFSSNHIHSGDVRWGHFLSSLEITSRNPLFGVGEYNWENENAKNKSLVGDAYRLNENPHNAIAQIFSMFGIPAGVLFGLCLCLWFIALYRIKLLKGIKWIIWVGAVVCVFFASANLMDAIFTTYYFYFFAALIFSIEMDRGQKNFRKVIFYK